MKEQDYAKLGIPRGETLSVAKRCFQRAANSGMGKSKIKQALRNVAGNPRAHAHHAQFGELAAALLAETYPTRTLSNMPHNALPEEVPLYQWGTGLDVQAVHQMQTACRLPSAVRGALMPDAHVGYGLPIGGVLATRGAVIPYAVGVDIACRMKLTVLDLPHTDVFQRTDRLKRALHAETRFGVGAAWKQPRQHPVMDRDWSVSPVTQAHKDKAWKQLGTSGSGNHFVEFGILTIRDEVVGLDPGDYLALLSHSGSRGTGASVCQHYAQVAEQRVGGTLDRASRHLAWLDLDSEAGQEYWAAMNLMGAYAAANHACIHRHVAGNLGARVLLDLENHHNFAWKEQHDGEELIVHRKGATPAAEGELGIIPGSMTAPGYIVRGRGHRDALRSAAHGAGRCMSRKKAKQIFKWPQVKEQLEQARVTLLSAGLDEAPMAYKDIEEVMAAQADLVDVVARFQPHLVKMAPAGERPED